MSTPFPNSCVKYTNVFSGCQSIFIPPNLFLSIGLLQNFFGQEFCKWCAEIVRRTVCRFSRRCHVSLDCQMPIRFPLFYFFAKANRLKILTVQRYQQTFFLDNGIWQIVNILQDNLSPALKLNPCHRINHLNSEYLERAA